MRVAIGADHVRYPLKENLREHMQKLGHEVLDLGTHDTQPVDLFQKALFTNEERHRRRLEKVAALEASARTAE